MRTFALLTFVVSSLLISSPSFAADREFMRQWDRVQKLRPATIPTSGAIASRDEPGIPMRLDGRLLTNGGRAAVRDAVVFAWQTDATGVYDRPGTPVHSWRLYGWAKTDARGTFTFTTIRPAAYPSGSEPAHVHFTVERRDGRRYFVPSLMFEDDPLVTPATRANRNAIVAPVKRTTHGESVGFILNLEEDERF